MYFLETYGIFLLETITIVAAILITLAGIIAIKSKDKTPSGQITVANLNEKYDEMREALQAIVLSKKAYKKLIKKKKKTKKKPPESSKKSNLYVINFTGDIKASGVDHLREEVTAILTIATPKDEVLIRLESPGGLVHSYGLAASQLHRFREHKIPLTIAVDKVAASGGYMMACVGNKILSAPFAVLGSVGVIAQLPNFHRLLKKWNIDFEQMTAGEYKRTVSLFGKNTDKGRQKFQEDVEEIHQLFKSYVATHRPIVDIDQIATGEIWYGQNALNVKLVDELTTSDDYLLNASDTANLFEIKYAVRKKFLERVTEGIQVLLTRAAVSFQP